LPLNNNMKQLLVLGLLSALCCRSGGQSLKDDSVALPAGAAVPSLPTPTAPVFKAGAPSVRSGELELVQARDEFGGFVVRVAGEPVAIGQNHPEVAWLEDGHVRWQDLAGASGLKLKTRSHKGQIEVSIQFQDREGAQWQISQAFTALSVAGAIGIEATAKVDRDRAVVFLPMFVVFPGSSSFGTGKGQGLFAGLEYLDNEPSSSEADVIGPASKRQVPDNLKITFPLMAIQHGGRYVGLTWQMDPEFSALFDSPDCIFNSGGHVMGLLFPGSDGRNRVEGNLLPRAGRILRANQPLALHATLLGGKGESIVPAVQQYVAMRGLPPMRNSVDVQSYVSLAAGGWLDSKIREGDLFRHAAWANFGPTHAADAALWMEWLAAQTERPELANRLEATARSALASVAPEDWNFAAIGHIRHPAPTLVFGHVAENAARAEQSARQQLGNFEPDLSVHYHPQPGGIDLARTYFTNEANGLTANLVAELLEAAAFSGDPELIKGALERLQAMDKFRNGVPRGAQTWECPLHTPDILASAHLVHAYTLGYELSGNRDFLDQARYWAWTGVPFVYLHRAVDAPIGLYATIAVFGATQWKAPVWLGLPVQWCGLVYAESLYRLARHDPQGPWKILADGITISGIEQTWPPGDVERQGLLPDSFVLRGQGRNPPPINPGTVQACATRLYNRPVYDFRCFLQNGIRVHAPGEIEEAREQAGGVSFKIASWPAQTYFVLINGLKRRPKILLNGKAPEAESCEYLKPSGRLILKLRGEAQVELGLGAP
jgi:hypothetical protein